jgi:hypothetical protein
VVAGAAVVGGVAGVVRVKRMSPLIVSPSSETTCHDSV